MTVRSPWDTDDSFFTVAGAREDWVKERKESVYQRKHMVIADTRYPR
jgi:hypothetical protein